MINFHQRHHLVCWMHVECISTHHHEFHKKKFLNQREAVGSPSPAPHPTGIVCHPKTIVLHRLAVFHCAQKPILSLFLRSLNNNQQQENKKLIITYHTPCPTSLTSTPHSINTIAQNYEITNCLNDMMNSFIEILKFLKTALPRTRCRMCLGWHNQYHFLPTLRRSVAAPPWWPFVAPRLCYLVSISSLAATPQQLTPPNSTNSLPRRRAILDTPHTVYTDTARMCYHTTTSTKETESAVHLSQHTELSCFWPAHGCQCKPRALWVSFSCSCTWPHSITEIFSRWRASLTSFVFVSPASLTLPCLLIARPPP